jgi:YfiH family protein
MLLGYKATFLFSDLFKGTLSCGFSARGDGNMSLAYAVTRDSLRNRALFLSLLCIDERSLVCAKQVHRSQVRYATENDRGKGALTEETALSGTDALITDIRGLPLAIFSADCLVVFLYDPKKSAIGLVHAGWRGTRDGIVSKTLAAMKSMFNTRPQDVYAGFGPSIRRCCYQVGPEFQSFFPGDVTEISNAYYFDIAGANKKQLLSNGVPEINMFDSRLCTLCRSDDFFSFRKEGDAYGRMMSVIMLK